MEDTFEYVNVRAGNEILCVPVALIEKHSPAQWRWFAQPQISKPSKRMEADASVAWQLYRAEIGSPINLARVLPKRVLTPFQFWLRNKLTALRMI